MPSAWGRTRHNYGTLTIEDVAPPLPRGYQQPTEEVNNETTSEARQQQPSNEDDVDAITRAEDGEASERGPLLEQPNGGNGDQSPQSSTFFGIESRRLEALKTGWQTWST